MGAGEVEISAFEIHRAIHLANPELLGALVSPFGVPRQNQAVLHTHMPYTTALCCIDKSNLPGSPVALSLRTRPNGQRVQMCSQNALRRSVGRRFHGAQAGRCSGFWQEVAEDDVYKGLVQDPDEGSRFSKALATRRGLDPTRWACRNASEEEGESAAAPWRVRLWAQRG